MKSLTARTILAAVIAVVVAAVPLAVIFSAETGPKTTLERADEQFGKHNYKKALELFEIVLKSDQSLGERPRVEMKVIVCKGKLGDADGAEKLARTLAAKYPGTIWEARGYHFLGNLLRSLPHWGYRLGDVITRGRHVEGAIYVPLYEKDNKEAVEALEKAKALYYALEKDGDLTGKDKESLPGEVIALNFDLAETLAGRGRPHYPRPMLEDTKETDEGEKAKVPPYDKWNAYRTDGDVVDKILFLYGEIPAYDRSDEQHPSALALYRKGMYLVQLNQLTYDRGRQHFEAVQAGTFKYVYEDPKKVFVALIEKYPKDELADEAQYALARVHQHEGDYVAAITQYAALIETFRQSKWIDDCKAAIQEIKWARLTVTPQRQHYPPGKRPVLSISARNAKTIRFTAYRVKLEELILRESVLYARDWNFSRFNQLFSGAFAQEKVAEWTLDTKDDGKHYWYNGTSELPITERGRRVRGQGRRRRRELQCGRDHLGPDAGAEVRPAQDRDLCGRCADGPAGGGRQGGCQRALVGQFETQKRTPAGDDPRGHDQRVRHLRRQVCAHREGR